MHVGGLAELLVDINLRRVMVCCVLCSVGEGVTSGSGCPGMTMNEKNNMSHRMDSPTIEPTILLVRLTMVIICIKAT